MSLQREQFLGAWRLVQWQVAYPDGRITFPYGENAGGLLLYTRESMSATVTAAGRLPLPAANPRSAPEAARANAFDSYFHYAGSWRLEGDEVVHEVELALNPAMAGTTQRRLAEFHGKDVLTLSAVEPLPGRGARRHELSWSRIADSN